MLKSSLCFHKGKRGGRWAEKAAKGQTGGTVQAPGESPREHVVSLR